MCHLSDLLILTYADNLHIMKICGIFAYLSRTAIKTGGCFGKGPPQRRKKKVFHLERKYDTDEQETGQ